MWFVFFHFFYISLNPLNNIIIANIVLSGLEGNFVESPLPNITPGIDPSKRLSVNT